MYFEAPLGCNPWAMNHIGKDFSSQSELMRLWPIVDSMIIFAYLKVQIQEEGFYQGLKEVARWLGQEGHWEGPQGH